MRSKPLLIPLALAGFAGLAAQSALAGSSGYPVSAPAPSGYTAGSLILRVGASFVDPDDDNLLSRTIPFTVVEDVEVDPEILNVDAVLSLDYDDDTTWYIGGVYLFADHWGVELQYIGNASHEADLDARVFAGNVLLENSTLVGGIGDFEADITSLMIDWFPLDPSCLVQPYVGLGVNYTNIDHDNDFKQVRSVLGSGATFADGNLNLGSDFSWVAQVGVDFVLGHNSNWIINAAAMYVDAEPDLELGFNLLADVPPPFDSPASFPVRVRGDFDYSPWVFNLGIGYKFSF